MRSTTTGMANRLSTTEASIIRFEGFTLDVGARALADCDGQDVPLRRSEFALLQALVGSPGRVLSREHLLDAAAGRRAEPFDRSIDVLVGRLRRKIEADPKAPRLIVTVRGAGYKFTGTPQAVQLAAGGGRRAWPHDAERRQLTIMVCGCGGPTPLSARLDPETLHRVIIAYQACCAEIIGRFGGVVARRNHDGLVAYFGYPVADEHGAERAVRAGLGIIEAAARLDIGPAAALGTQIGIATGDVVIGDILGDDAREHAALGEAPDLSARLMMAADPGTVVISGSTRRLVGGLFEFSVLDAARSFRVLGEGVVESRFEALHAIDLTPLVGREEEIALLLRRWERAKTGAGRVVHIMADPGIGKSRLMRELRVRLADDRHRSMEFFCSPLHRDTPYHPFSHQIETAAGFSRSDSNEPRLAKLKSLLAACGEPGTVALIADLMSIPTDGRYPAVDLGPRQRRGRIAEALIARILDAGEGEPLLLVFEDVHWIDPTSREILETLVEHIRERRVLAVVTSRPEFVPTWPSQVQVDALPLGRLDDREVGDMVAEVAGRHLPAELHRHIVERADGVPLFVEELTKAVVEKVSDESTILPDLTLPASLHDSLMARLDRLPAAKAVAQMGAAIGRIFAHDLVSALVPQPEPDLRCALDELVGSALVTRRGSAPHATYTFKHALVQNAAYESLLHSRRAMIHARIVEVLLEQEPGIATTEPALLAYHCEQGGLTAQAVDYYARAGRQSAVRGSWVEGRERFGHALRLIATWPEGKERDRAELDALAGLEYALQLQKGYATSEAPHHYPRTTELWERLGRPPEFLSVAYSQFLYHLNRDGPQHAQHLAESLLRSSQQHGGAPSRVMGHHCAGGAAMHRGQLVEARSHLEEVIRLPEPLSDGPNEFPDLQRPSPRFWLCRNIALNWLALTMGWLGYPDRALAHSAVAVGQGKHEGIAAAADCLAKRAELLSFLHAPSEFAGLVAELNRLTHKHDMAFWDARATILKGHTLALCDDPVAGRTLIREGIDRFAASGSVLWYGLHRAWLAETHQMVDETDTALRILTEALEETERTGEQWYSTELHRRSASRTGTVATTLWRDVASSRPSTLPGAKAQSCGNCKPRPATPGCCAIRASRPRPPRFSPQSMPGSPKASTRCRCVGLGRCSTSLIGPTIR